VAVNPSLPHPLLRILVDDPAETVRAATLANPAVPVHLLAAGSTDASLRVRRAAALHRRSPGAILRRLGDDDTATVRASVAANPSTPPEVLDRLATESSRLGAAVARNAAASSVVHLALLDRGDAATTAGLALHSPHAAVLGRLLG
jgi:hypothetical protein